ncbi:MAG TPA: urease accessory protein UreD [Polyangiales bacterium]|nr:urease accessory protein UreD [Polyangiales bacterium]
MLERGWEAALALSFVRDEARARTELHERTHRGPLRVQRPFYPEGGVCHVYVLHPPGGLVSGDRLSIEVKVEPGAHALLTTPAATKLYRSSGERATQQQRLRVANGARLEWLPQETIAFDAARAALSTSIELTGDARFIGWEILCLGRPASDERFERGELAQSIEIARDDRTLYIERGVYAGGGAILDAAWGLAGRPVVGTFLCAIADAERCLDAARAIASDASWAPALAAVSCWNDLLVARYLGASAEQARELFTALWRVVRPALMDCPVSEPRIWRT